ncbi:MAG: hypothetical protein J6D29_05410 [Solobacterium sp.]|nr:hypothetical protein [Solobacterium sp.]
MNLKEFDQQCVRITTTDGEVYEGIVSFDSAEYVYHEYGRKEEALRMTPLLFYKRDIANIKSLEEVNGPYGHYSEKYGLFEKKCFDWGTDLIEEVLDCEDDIQIYRMLLYMDDHFPLLIERANATEDTLKDEQGPIDLEDLKKMLHSLIKYNQNSSVLEEAKHLLTRLENLPS